MAWEDVYPILKNYKNDLNADLVKSIEERMDSIMQELENEGLSKQDAVLVAKDILWKQWQKSKKKKK